MATGVCFIHGGGDTRPTLRPPHGTFQHGRSQHETQVCSVSLQLQLRNEEVSKHTHWSAESEAQEQE